MRALAGKRGCGTRQQGGAYLESGLGPFGVPIEALIMDAPLGEGEVGTPEWFVPHRSPILVEHGGAHHFVIWVGEEHYPNVFDFIEECRTLGASRRVPSNLDFSKIGPNSRMIFVHPKAGLNAKEIEMLECPCPRRALSGDLAKRFPAHTSFAHEPRCIGGALYVPKSEISRPGVAFDPLSKSDISCHVREIPCGHSYRVYELPDVLTPAALQYKPAVFLQMAITGVALINKSDGSFDEQIEERARKAKIDVFRADE